MRRLCALLLLALIGCDPASSPTTVHIEGTPGIGFRGSVSHTLAGSAKSQSVEGTVPASFTVRGEHVSAAMQKTGEAGTLKVILLRNGETLTESETSAPYGATVAAK